MRCAPVFRRPSTWRAADRLLMQSKVNMTVSLPRSHYEKVKAAKGVRAVAPFNWFGGIYKDASSQIQVQATDPEAVPGGVSGDAAHAGRNRSVEARSPGPSSSARCSPINTAGKSATAFRCARRSGASSTAATPGISTSSASMASSVAGVQPGQRLFPVRLFQRVAAVRQGPVGWW